MTFKDLEDAVLDVTTATFGTPSTYTPVVGSPVIINGVFDNIYIEVGGVSSLKPALRIKLADLASAPAKGDQVTVNSVTYRVLSAENDAYGGSTLILHKV